ncbi:MAG: flagellar biosynthesis anti-sigma factor FlgM [Leptolinea sp.]|jgi:negative regulator of flagellin synthesis FlgM|nr:flagellar biosynthesis anti-sigma factor FlgM [Leptolinea sp.]
MKIENNSASNILAQKTENLNSVERSQLQKSTSAPAARTTEKDHAILSDQAQLLSKALAEMEGTPEVRMEKVEALRSQILDGQYQINYEELAKKMSGLPGLK